MVQVDDKYQYSLENMENKVHGWESMNPHVGFWMITPSDEFRTAGPVKQDLTSHVGPTTLSVSPPYTTVSFFLFFFFFFIRSNVYKKKINLFFYFLFLKKKKKKKKRCS